MSDAEVKRLRERHARTMEWASRGRGIADQLEMIAIKSPFSGFWLWVARRVRRMADNNEMKARDDARDTYQ